ncbi:MAG: hydrogenase maturation peptidase HycI [Candidatus Thorarchaeota archaeon]|nr:hydrogenase maturation peptidase HycI [Candidatus Thorarchaeota archaeon]
MNDTDSLAAALLDFLSGGRRIAILGIGNDLRHDDGLGPFVVTSLHLSHPSLMIENVGSVPEAFARPIAEFGADRVILVDAADMRKPVGHTELITKDRIGGIAISTHHMPLSFLMLYLEQETGAKTVLLGVQPQNIDFGEGLTPEVDRVARNIISLLDRVLAEYIRGIDNVSDN